MILPGYRRPPAHPCHTHPADGSSRSRSRDDSVVRNVG